MSMYMLRFMKTLALIKYIFRLENRKDIKAGFNRWSFKQFHRFCKNQSKCHKAVLRNTTEFLPT